MTIAFVSLLVPPRLMSGACDCTLYRRRGRPRSRCARLGGLRRRRAAVGRRRRAGGNGRDLVRLGRVSRLRRNRRRWRRWRFGGARRGRRGNRRRAPMAWSCGPVPCCSSMTSSTAASPVRSVIFRPVIGGTRPAARPAGPRADRARGQRTGASTGRQQPRLRIGPEGQAERGSGSRKRLAGGQVGRQPPPFSTTTRSA